METNMNWYIASFTSQDHHSIVVRFKEKTDDAAKKRVLALAIHKSNDSLKTCGVSRTYSVCELACAAKIKPYVIRSPGVRPVGLGD
jgi:hypothetical protein